MPKLKIKPRRPTLEAAPEIIETTPPVERPPLEIPMNPDRAARLGLLSEPIRAINPMSRAANDAGRTEQMATVPIAPIAPTGMPMETAVKPQNPMLSVNAEMMMKQGLQPSVATVPVSPIRAVNPLLNQSAADTAAADAPAPAAAIVETSAPSNANAALRPSQQTAAKISELQTRKYSDKWGILDTLKGAGLGALRGYAATGSIGGALGGAGVGAVQGTIDPNTDEKFAVQNKIARLSGLQGQQQKQEAFDLSQEAFDLSEDRARIAGENISHDNKRQDSQDAAKQETENRNSLLRQVRMMKRYKQGENPDFDAKLETANIEQPDFEPDKRIKPRYYDGGGKLMTFDENGATVPVLNAKGEEVVDDSRANISVGGYIVKGRDALGATTAAGVKNTQYLNDDEKDQIAYENDKRETEAANRGVDAEIQSRREIAANLQLANETLQSQRAQLNTNPLLNSDQIKLLDQQINSNTNDWRKANGEITALGGKKKPVPVKPTPRQQVNVPSVKSLVDGTTAAAQIKKLFPKDSEVQIAARVAQAKRDGWVK